MSREKRLQGVHLTSGTRARKPRAISAGIELHECSTYARTPVLPPAPALALTFAPPPLLWPLFPLLLSRSQLLSTSRSLAHAPTQWIVTGLRGGREEGSQEGMLCQQRNAMSLDNDDIRSSITTTTCAVSQRCGCVGAGCPPGSLETLLRGFGQYCHHHCYRLHSSPRSFQIWP